jgi:hypothetical protein
MMLSRPLLAAALVLPAVMGGCGVAGHNPSLALSRKDARCVLEQMREDPKPLARPVVVAGGIHDPGLISSRIARHLRRVCTNDEEVFSVSFFIFDAGTFDECRDKLIEAVEKRFPSPDETTTVEVDVVGFSMGGLVARHAARPRSDGGRRLKIRRLFTIASPHRGARLANLPTFDRRKIDMRSGSEFLAALDTDLAEAEYDLYPYTRLGDLIVGAENTAPPGVTPWWVSNPMFSMSHVGASKDTRILADIASRLRDEPPLATSPPAPFEPPDAGQAASSEDAADAQERG